MAGKVDAETPPSGEMESKSSETERGGGGLFGALQSWGGSIFKSINSFMGYEDVVNPEGGQEDAQEEAKKSRFKPEEREHYWTMMSKYVGADVTSLVTLPVVIVEPMTTLQKMAEIMEYSELLNQANMCEDPQLRLVYAVTWAVSVYFAYQRAWKPFNPILGETYEMEGHNGTRFIAEQVSHHPPMGAAHAENEHFIYDITSKLKTKFLGNSLDVYPVGRTRVVLKRTGDVLDLVPPPTKVHNLIFGRTWIDSYGDMVLTNLTTGDKVVLYFQPCGWFGVGRYEVDGYVYDANETPKYIVSGKWNSSMGYVKCDADGEPLEGQELEKIWEVAPAPENDKYSYTYFAHKINNFDSSPKHMLPSDSRVRPDRLALEKGDSSTAAAEKHRLEERQRWEKAQREQRGEPWAPRWFRPTGEIACDGDLPIYEFTDSYNEHHADQANGTSDNRTKDFCPWQFPGEYVV
ncbi:hypothetical protein CBR_g8578 [Chara braunii]|uniref:Oxysterol-binding protein n=1 Tax=Chara braunii TaxID=69332 RepID=A0A388JRZ2_CHABU|nr:hypothetical protein CBR_g8578 [Chara braunii]|eukprot:GBG60555.1 hypothetical protein CBR_g8578 [Chara braunii]